MMDSLRISTVLQFTQYLSGLTSSQNTWAEAIRALKKFFEPEFAGYVVKQNDDTYTFSDVLFSDISQKKIFDPIMKNALMKQNDDNLRQSKLFEAVDGTFKTGFLTTLCLQDTHGVTIAFFPIIHESNAIRILMLGKSSEAKFTKESLNLYLAITGFIGNVFSQLQSERELKQHRYHLEEQVEKRTAELKKLNIKLNDEIVLRTIADQKIEHLYRVLRGINNVNQLISREKDQNELLKQVCFELIKTKGFFNAWIALLDDKGKLTDSAQANVGKDFKLLINQLENNNVPSCAKEALNRSEVLFLNNPATECLDCVLASKYKNRSAFIARIEHAGKIYGLLAVSAKKDIISLDEEIVLLKEVASDIAFAMHNLELENMQKYVLEELARKQNLLNITGNIAKIGGWEYDVLNGKITWSDATKIIHQVPLDYEPDLESGLAFYPGKNSEIISRAVAHAVETGEEYDLELQFVTAKGKKLWIRTLGYPLFEKNKCKTLFGTIQDITDKKIAEENLENTLKEQEAIFNSSLVGIMVLKNRIITKINDEMAKMLGYSQEEIVGKGPEQLHLSMDNFHEFGEKYYWRLSNKEIVDIEYPLKYKNGKTVWCQFNGKAINPPDLAKGAVWIIQDITERKLAEKELKRNRERLNTANSILRHDVANDISTIESALYLYRHTNDDKMLDEIEKRVNKSINTIKKQREQEEFINAHSDLDIYNIKEIAGDLTQNYPDIKINITGIGSAYADHAIYSVFDNIIGNAIKHGKASKLDINIYSDEDFCEIRLADNGIGIPDEYKNDVFKEGFQYGKTGNTGIGLFIVKKTIDSYDGLISIEDNKPRGTVFVIRLRKIIERAKN